MKATIGENEITINKGSYYQAELMKEDALHLQFSHSELMALPAGTEASAEGYSGVLLQDYAPTYNVNTGAYDYDCVFNAAYMQGKNKLVKFKDYGVIFDITDSPASVLGLIASSAGWTAGACPSGLPMVNIHFEGVNCIDALNQLCNAMDENGYYEWWFDGNTVNVGKLGEGSDRDGGIALNESNILSITSSGGSQRKTTRLYAYGGTKNISARSGANLDVNASESKIINIDGWETNGYYDPLRVVCGSMFKESVKSYLVLSKPARMDELLKNHKVTGSNDAFFSLELILRSVIVNDKSTSAKITFSNKSARVDISDYTDSNGDAAKDYKTVTVSLVVVEDSNRLNAKVLCEVDSATYEGADVGHTGSGKCSIDFNLPEALYFDHKPGTRMRLALRVTVKRELDSAELNIAFKQSDFRYEIISTCYNVNCGDVFGWWNPGLYPDTDERANVFGSKGTGRPEGLLYSRVPISWFNSGSTQAYAAFTAAGRLTLPGVPYVGEDDSCEAMQIFEDIYPCSEGEITDVCGFMGVPEKDSNGVVTGRTLCYYTFTCSEIANLTTEDYVDEKAHVVFKSGVLMGMDFELSIQNTSSGGTVFAIIPNEEYGTLIPNESLLPAKGDQYALYGLDESLYTSGGLYEAAQARLKKAAEAHLALLNMDTATYACTMKPTKVTSDLLAAELGTPAAINFGGVQLSSRVIGVKKYLDLPQAGLEITVGNSVPYRKIDYIERKVKLNK